jgi:hypothetical protein
MLAAGDSHAEILGGYERLTEEDIVTEHGATSEEAMRIFWLIPENPHPYVGLSLTRPL